MNNKTLSATLAALFAQIIFGFSFMFTKIALGFASPITVIANRYIVAFIGLVIVLFATKTKIRRIKGIWKMVIMSLFQPVLYFLCETYGIKLTTSAFSSIMISLIPVVSMLFGMVFLKEIPSGWQYLFTTLSVLGVTVMALVGKADGSVTIAGILLLFGAVISAVAYNLISRRISAEFTAIERTFAMTVIGLVIFVLIAFMQNLENPIELVIHFLDRQYFASVLYLGLISSVLAFILLNYANTYLPVAKTTVFANITTVVSVFAGIIFLDEKLSFITVICAIMIITGVWGVQLLSVKKKN